MAPILTTTSGVSNQVLDDPDLIDLLKSLHDIPIVSLNEVCSYIIPNDIERLCNLLQPWHKEWRFEEQVSTLEVIFSIFGLGKSSTYNLST
jgi:hypothetical protein